MAMLSGFFIVIIIPIISNEDECLLLVFEKLVHTHAYKSGTTQSTYW